MSAFKVVGRYKKQENQKSWCRGKPGTQAKKRVYIDEFDYLKYSSELIARWATIYDVEIYKKEGSKWALVKHNQPENALEQ
jgi:hypothetical protein